jgi:hypothetical protein
MDSYRTTTQTKRRDAQTGGGTGAGGIL